MGESSSNHPREGNSSTENKVDRKGRLEHEKGKPVFVWGLESHRTGPLSKIEGWEAGIKNQRPRDPKRKGRG